MARLAQLTIYPIKSCAGIAVQEASLTETGLASNGIRDREWMLVDERGQFLSQRTQPRMALIRPQLVEGALVLAAPGMPEISLPTAAPATVSSCSVKVWKDQLPALDCGEAIAGWLSRFLDLPCRLVRFHPEAQRIASPKWTQGTESHYLFSDSFPFLIIGQASLDDLNRRLSAAGRVPLPMNRFRPNIVIDDMPAYAEDHLQTLRIHGAALQLVRPCQRCPIPAIDQATGEKGDDPMDILKTYHTSSLINGAVTFGMHAILAQGENTKVSLGLAIQTQLLSDNT